MFFLGGWVVGVFFWGGEGVVLKVLIFWVFFFSQIHKYIH